MKKLTQKPRMPSRAAAKRVASPSCARTRAATRSSGAVRRNGTSFSSLVTG